MNWLKIDPELNTFRRLQIEYTVNMLWTYPERKWTDSLSSN